MTKTALVTGITGQDGSYLGEFLLSKGYKVIGLIRRTSFDGTFRISHLNDKITLVNGDLGDNSSLIRVLQEVQPDEIYNLGAMSFVPTSWKEPISTGNITGLGVARMLEAIRLAKPDTRFYQASSSEMFGKVKATPQNEETPFHPRSPYGVAKVYGHWITVNYRESHGLFAVSGILFNHESPRRGLEFVTRKISHGVASIKLGLQEELLLGNLEAKRDWGFAGDYVKAMWSMLQQDEPEDYVIASGENHSVREFAEIAFNHAEMDYRDYVKTDKKFLRPADVDELVGDASKARKKLGWKPEMSFRKLVEFMVDEDLKLLKEKSGQNA